MKPDTPTIPLTPVTLDIIINLHCCFDDYKKIIFWLTTNNLNFGGLSPLELIRTGKSKKVRAFINTALSQGVEI